MESIDTVLELASPIAYGLDIITVMKGVVGVAQLLVNMGKVCLICDIHKLMKIEITESLCSFRTLISNQKDARDIDEHLKACFESLEILTQC